MTAKPPNPEDLKMVLDAFGSHIIGPLTLSEAVLQAVERTGVHIRDLDGQTLLMKATENWHTSNIDFLLEKGALINDVDERGSTALHHALNGGVGAELVHKLIDAGANLEAKEKNGRTPLIYGLCRAYDKEDCADGLMTLIERGADLEAAVGSPAYLRGYRLGQTALEIILDPGNKFPERLVDCVCRALAKRSQSDLKNKLSVIEGTKTASPPRVM